MITDPYCPNYHNITDSPDELIAAIRDSLKFWLMIHTDPATWLADWTAQGDDYTINHIYENGISNDYFSFDVQEAVLTEWARDNVHLFCQCQNCDQVSEWGFEDECGCTWEDEESDWGDCSEEELINWLRDTELKPPDFEDYVEQVLINQGFSVYRAALEPVTCGIEEECREAIDRIDSAESNYDRLAIALQAASIYHVHGSIFEDYGWQCGLDYADLDTLRSEGLQAYFTPEEVREWLEEDSSPVRA